MATTNDIIDFIEELKTIIRGLPMLTSSEFNRYNKHRIKRLSDFREFIFKKELDNISELLSSISSNKLSILQELTNDFDRIKNEIRYVSKSSFMNNFRNIIKHHK